MKKAKVITALALATVMLVVMTGLAAATLTTSPDHVYVNIATNAVSDVTITFTGPKIGDLCMFNIIDDSTALPSTELQGSFDGTNWYSPNNSGNEAPPNSVTYNSVGNNYTSVWHFQIADHGDGDDTTQMGKNYTLQFIIFNGSVSWTTGVGATTTGVTATDVPEFVTIALPALSILGLFLFYSRRKRKEE